MHSDAEHRGTAQAAAEPHRDAGLLGAYVLPGHVRDPLPGIGQALEAERLGLGSIWLSDRWASKESGAMCGALAHATSAVSIGTAVTHFGTRHPVVLAGMALTLQALSDQRFVLGVGRSVPSKLEKLGVPVMTTSAIGDHASIVRRLWAGETFSYDGVAGSFPELELESRPDVPPPPLALAAIGPRTLRLAGELFDAVLLHPFLTTRGVERSVGLVREAARDAGRDTDAVEVHAMTVAAPGFGPDEEDLVIRARAAQYFAVPGLGEVIVEINGWDPGELDRFRSLPLLRQHASSWGREEFVRVGDHLPSEWLADGAATGGATDCAARFHEYLDAGADRLVVHGVTPERMADTVDAFAEQARSSP